MTRKTGSLLATVLLVAALAATGYWMLFSSFAVYDDEGYILLSAREYLVHGALYEKVYTQYGPAFYVLLDGLQRALGSPVDHTSARLLTLVFWLGAAVCSGLLVWRQTASRSLSFFTLSATFLYLYFITDEPFHPGSLIFFILALSVYVATRLIEAGRLAGAAAIAGAAGAFLLLTKINVGAFYLSGVAAWAVVNAASDRMRRLAKPGVVVLLILFAAALMHTLLREAWIQIYLALFASGAVTLIIAMKGEALIKSRQAGWFFAAGASLALAIAGLVWLRGTSLAGLLEGVFLGPLRHPGNYSYPVDWRPGTLLVAGLSLALALAHPWIGRKFSGEIADRLIVTLRLLLTAALLTGFALLINFRAVGAIFSYVAPLIWIWVVPLKGVEQPPATRSCRGLLASILLLQYLHAYPVGGSQESWGTFLFMPLVALGLGDVRRWLTARTGSNAPVSQGWSRLGAVLLIVVFAKVGVTAVVAQRNYSARSALGLPGAEQLHLPELQRASCRVLARNAAVHADLLFSLPGMFSFNLWTDLPTPTEKNTTLWFTLLNDTEQKEIIQALEQAPHAGLIVQETLVELMQANSIPMKGVLWDYLHRNFVSAFRADGVAFWVHQGRTIAPLNLATVSERSAPDPTGRLRDTQLDFCLVHEGTPIAAIEIRTGMPEHPVTQLLNAANAEVTLASINTSGQARAAPTGARWPLTCHGPVRLDIYFDRNGLALLPATTLLYLRGPAGENLGEIMIGK